jgi:hypothetical protein
VNLELQKMLIREEINIIKALKEIGYWPGGIRFDSSGTFSVSGSRYNAGNPDYMRFLKAKENELAALEASSREQAKGSVNYA